MTEPDRIMAKNGAGSGCGFFSSAFWLDQTPDLLPKPHF